MTEPTPTGALACPFVAFEADRDARADTPDHRHRCYAEIRPAPRALAHQEAFCLSPGFAACPTFQDWARREAARAEAAPVTGTSWPAWPGRAARAIVRRGPTLPMSGRRQPRPGPTPAERRRGAPDAKPRLGGAAGWVAGDRGRPR